MPDKNVSTVSIDISCMTAETQWHQIPSINVKKDIHLAAVKTIYIQVQQHTLSLEPLQSRRQLEVKS